MRFKSYKRTKTHTTQTGPSVFNYLSRCCDVRTEKEPCRRTEESREANEYSTSPLGCWTCSRCHTRCKVTRVRNREVPGELVVS